MGKKILYQSIDPRIDRRSLLESIPTPPDIGTFLDSRQSGGPATCAIRYFEAQQIALYLTATDTNLVVVGVTGVTRDEATLIESKLGFADRMSRALFQAVAEGVLKESLAPEDQDGNYTVRDD